MEQLNSHIVKPEGNLYLKMLVFAPSGRGKTTFCGTAQLDERTSPTLLLDFEGNTEVLLGLDVDIWPVRNWKDFEEAYSFLRSDSKYKSVGIDSLSEVNSYALLEELNRRVKIGGPGRDEYPDQAQKQDFGAILVQMRRFIRRFRDLPKHLIFTAIDDTEPEPGEGVVKIAGMIGKMRREVGGLMTTVGYIALDPKRTDEHGEPLHVMLLKNNPEYRIKARSGWALSHTIPSTIDSPTVGKLIDAIYPKPKLTIEKTA